ncbi:sugar efflux transporter [Streptomyces lycii]|uniref:MFS transporter n=1 Tax=Streptomyces lycii TaxID=2654337 RepID=A0ABQ7FKP9_9ACTN|nr:sugar efflux transporter [Streptomyces lycii]KAF4408199.1 MFS transporter [Streptomyces lycii]
MTPTGSTPPAEALPAEAPPGEPEPVGSRAAGAQRTEAQHTEAGPAEARPAEARTTETRPAAAPPGEPPHTGAPPPGSPEPGSPEPGDSDPGSPDPGSPAPSLRARASAARRRAAVLFRDGALGGLIGSTGLIGIAGAMMSTSSSLFLADEIGATPLMIGLFAAGRGLMDIVSGLTLGALSDRIGNRRLLLTLSVFLSAAGALTYMLVRDYYLLLGTGAILFGLGSACFSQLLAYTRDFAENRALNATFFNSLLRAITSLTWIIGPPIGFLLIATFGFGVLYFTAAMLYLSGGVLSLWLLPNLRTEDAGRRPPGRAFSGINSSTWLLMAAVVLLLAVNNAYQIDIALFVTRDLGFDAGFTGLLLGLAAALEVPTMMYLGSRADRFGKWRLVLSAAVCATLFFAVLPLVETKAMLLLMQVPNAFWTAIVLSIPVTILQDAMADRVGAASSLYTSSFHGGVLLGGATTGVVTQWLGFTKVFWVCALLTAVATLLIALGRNGGEESGRAALKRAAAG